MVIMASGTARGRVRTTTATGMRKMAYIHQLIGWQRHASWFLLSFFDIGHLCYGKFTSLKQGIYWLYHVNISLTQVVSSLKSRTGCRQEPIMGSCCRLTRGLMSGWLVVNRTRNIKVKRSIFFLCYINAFRCFCFAYFEERLWFKLNTEG